MSSIPAAIDALLALLRARTGVQLVDGPPAANLEMDHIIVGGDDPAADGNQVPAALGGRHRTETYELVVQCGAYTGSGDDGAQKAVRDRAFGHMAVVEDVVRNHPHLAEVGEPAVVTVAQISGGISLDQALPADDDGTVRGRKAVVTFRVTCQTRI